MLTLQSRQEILKRLKKFSQSKKLSIINSFKSLENNEVIFLANPSQSMRSVLEKVPKRTKKQNL